MNVFRLPTLLLSGNGLDDSVVIVLAGTARRNEAWSLGLECWPDGDRNLILWPASATSGRCLTDRPISIYGENSSDKRYSWSGKTSAHTKFYGESMARSRRTVLRRLNAFGFEKRVAVSALSQLRGGIGIGRDRSIAKWGGG